MKDFWATVGPFALGGLGVLAELNLLRVFLRLWREDRREARSFQARPERPKAVAAARGRLIRAGVAACIIGPPLLSSAAHGQDAVTQVQPGGTPAATNQPEVAPPKSPFSLQLNLDYTTAYFYHGIIQEDSGLILQPAAKLTINLYEQDDTKVDAFVATWNSFHGQKTAAQTHGDFTEYWYESDLIGGFALTKGKFSLAAQYVILTSPSDAYETVQELDLTLAFDDTEALGKFALHPYALLGIETGADAADGANSDTGTYLELGIAPGFSFDMRQTPVSISFPASVGLSLENYYQNAAGDDDTFGFAQVCVKASVPLPFGDRYGKWTLNAGVSAMFLGDHTSEYNGGQDDQLVGTIGLQCSF